MNTIRYPKIKTCRTLLDRLADQNGMSLIYVIVIIVLFALIISASVVMFGTSTFTSATANSSQRATYLAESGLRFIREEFSKPSPPIPINQLLSEIYNRTYRLGGGSEGQFQITTIEPYWFSLTAPANSTNITLTAPGTSMPTEFSSMGTDAIKKLIVPPKFHTYNNGGSLSGTTFSGSLTEGLLYNTTHFPVFRVSEAAVGAAADSTSLTVKGTYFPEKRGQIGICESITSNICTNMRAFYYEASSVAGGNRTLTGIIPAQNTYTFPLVAADTNIILLGSVKMNSQGTFGQVDRNVENFYRAVNLYNTTGGTGPNILDPQISDFDTTTQGLQDLIDPAVSSIDQIKSIGLTDNDNTLNIGAADHTTGLIWWRWYDPTDGIASLPLDLYRLANGGKLNYGVQVKLKATTNKLKPYYMTGLSFRLDDLNNGNASTAPAVKDNMYAVSFLKIDSSYWGEVSSNKAYNWLQKIKNGNNWNPVTNGNWYLVLWKRVGGTGGTWTLMGYKQLVDSDWVFDESAFSADAKVAFKEWSTIRVDIMEEIATTGDVWGYTSGERYNIINTYVQSATVTDGYPPTPYYRRTTSAAANSPPNQYLGPIVWDENGTNFWKKVTWTLPNNTQSSTITDNSISTLNYAAIPDWTVASKTDPIYEHFAPRELGFHIFSDDPAQNTVFLDNFALKIEGGPGTVTGDPYLQ